MIFTAKIEATSSSARINYNVILYARKEAVHVCNLLLIVFIHSVKCTVNNDGHLTHSGIRNVEFDGFLTCF